MKLQSGEELLTIRDIAARIAPGRTEASIARTLRQVRHWTQCDLLRTVSVKSTGKGIPRLYEEEPTLLIAAVLLELSRYGATVDILKPVAAALYDDWEDDRMYIDTASTHVNVYLQVAWKTDPATGQFIDAEIKLFDDLDAANTNPRDRPTLLLEHATSSIIVNLTNLSWASVPQPTE